jgi:hypothetical protein
LKNKTRAVPSRERRRFSYQLNNFDAQSLPPSVSSPKPCGRKHLVSRGSGL